MDFGRRTVALFMSGGLVGGALTVGAAVARPLAVHAFNLTNCQWPKQPTGKTDVFWFDYSGDGSTYGDNWQAAANQWNASQNHVYLYGDPTGEITYEVIANDGNFGNAGYDGITYYNGCASGHTIESESVFLNRYYTDGYSSDGKLQVATHELGHALGLAHNNPTPCNGIPIMYYSSDRFFKCGIKSPQQDDVNGLLFMY